ncbi:MAG TPA: MASE1 domain-containing protein [Gaiellaceae bacterium]
MDRPVLAGMPTLGRTHLRAACWFALVTGSYVGAAKLGIHLHVSHGIITPVWAPSGISLAALLLLGLRYWPAVALGAFLANVTSDVSVAVAAGIAVGNTLEAVVGATIVRRFGFRPELDRVRSVIVFTVGAALVSTAIAATNGVTILTIAGERQDSYGTAWVLWWFGDAVGILMVAPLLLVFSTVRRLRLTLGQMVEGTALVLSLAGVSALVFLGGAWRYPYLMFPFLLWAALRFKSLGAATASFLVGAFGTWGAVAGEIPVGVDTATERVQVIQALFALVAVSLLVVGATLAEQEEGNEALARTASRLSEAQALAHIGSWEWDIKRDVVTWSDELYRIFGSSPDSSPGGYAAYIERLPPEEREFVNETVTRAYVDGRPFAFEHTLRREDGTERIIAARGQVVLEDGEPVLMLGTSQDVTDQRQAEKLRDDILSTVSHELRTPLASVLGFAITLEQRRLDLSDEELARVVAELVSASRRLERLLTDLLDVERARKGVIHLQRQRTDVLDLVERVVAECELDGRRVSITGGPVEAEIDAGKVERIVENLILNAVKHTPDTSSIRVGLDTDARDLILYVEDEGPGIPDEFKEVVFETFNRGPSMLSATPGAGIGLSLVSRFAEAHGGASWVEDRPGGGSSFRVLLPNCVV